MNVLYLVALNLKGHIDTRLRGWLVSKLRSEDMASLEYVALSQFAILMTLLDQ
jgi:hypothetical protein